MPLKDLQKRRELMTFEKTFTEGTKDTDLIHKLTTRDKLSGRLNLALVGLKQLELETIKFYVL